MERNVSKMLNSLELIQHHVATHVHFIVTDI